MTNPPIERTLTLRGEIVETFEKKGVRLVKVSFPSLHVELPMEMLEAAHLGDRVIISGSLVLQSVELDFGSLNHV